MNKEQPKYFLEKISTQQWYSIENLYEGLQPLPGKPDIWTNDPQMALKWEDKNQAEKYRDNYFDFPEYKITEHLFINDQKS